VEKKKPKSQKKKEKSQNTRLFYKNDGIVLNFLLFKTIDTLSSRPKSEPRALIKLHLKKACNRPNQTYSSNYQESQKLNKHRTFNI